MQTLLAVGVLGAIGIAGAQVIAAGRFRARILRLAHKLRDAPAPEARRDLPDIVYAFARRAGADPDAPPRSAVFRQVVGMRLKPGATFVPMVAWQNVTLGRAGFVWHARTHGLVPKFRILDAYMDGRGALEARLLGSIPVARSTGPTTDLGEGMRYLVELPWAPDAMLGNRQIGWRQIDAENVEARLETRGGTARIVFHFDAAGDITGAAARGRPAKDTRGRTVHYDWRGRFSGYREIGGRRIPTEGEVGYVYPTGYETYFRCEVTDYQIGV